jgi:DNA (cytosine-5)-methyltransferase 1
MESQETGIRSRSGDSGLGLRIGSLFAGVGLLELGLEKAGVGRTVYQVEVDAFCREQLARHWPGVPRWGDVRELDPAVLPAVDVVCGGFPCTDISVAAVNASRDGLRGARSGLWAHMARVVEHQRPAWVLVENVARGWKKWLPDVRRDLGGLGYATLPIPMEARYVGAPHVRQRIFLLAHAHGFQLRLDEQRVSGRRAEGVRDGREAVALEHGEHGGWGKEAQPCLSVLADGCARGMGKHISRTYGNAVVPQAAEMIGWVLRELVEAGA